MIRESDFQPIQTPSRLFDNLQSLIALLLSWVSGTWCR